MKRILLGLVLVSSLMFASLAAAKDVSGYTINVRAHAKPSAPMMSVNKIGYYATEISIYNDSPYYIYFTSNASFVAMPIEPYGFATITHPYYNDDVAIQLYDEHLDKFWDSWVCAKAQLNVEGYWWGGHHIDLNVGYCDYYFFKKK